MLIECFHERLANKVFYSCLSRGMPRTTQGWYVLADKVEIDLAKYHAHTEPRTAMIIQAKQNDNLQNQENKMPALTAAVPHVFGVVKNIIGQLIAEPQHPWELKKGCKEPTMQPF